MRWDGECVLSHGTNVSAGVAILFSVKTKINILSKQEVEKGRLLVLKVEINSKVFVFINIYAPTVGSDRIQLFQKLKKVLYDLDQDDFLIMGGD